MGIKLFFNQIFLIFFVLDLKLSRFFHLSMVFSNENYQLLGETLSQSYKERNQSPDAEVEIMKLDNFTSNSQIDENLAIPKMVQLNANEITTQPIENIDLLPPKVKNKLISYRAEQAQLRQTEDKSEQLDLSECSGIQSITPQQELMLLLGTIGLMAILLIILYKFHKRQVGRNLKDKTEEELSSMIINMRTV